MAKRLIITVGIIILISLAIILPMNVAGEVYNIGPNSEQTEYLFLTGKDDTVTINLISSSHPINIQIIREGEGLFDYDVVWEVNGVTNGQWTWTSPTDDSYYVEIINPDLINSVTIEIEITEDGLDGLATLMGGACFGSLCCIFGAVGFAIFVVIALIIIIIIMVKKKK